MLYAYVQNYLREDIYPFHMPGHKRGRRFFPAFPLDFDMTEFDGMDNLHAPEGVILRTQEAIARIYGARESFMLVNGATSGVIAAVCSVCGDGDKILAARNSHASLFSALLFSGAKPVFFYPEMTARGFAGAVPPEAVDRLLRLHEDCKAVFLTSPTYEGFISDIQSIAAVVHAHDKILIVDEAHGAHFPFHAIFPPSALSQGADITVNSLHKTLPALTQSALLHIQGGRADGDRLRFFLRCAQTSSPSYMLMSVMDCVLRRLSEDTELFETYAAALMETRKTLSNNISIELLSQSGMDPSKLLFVIHGGYTGAWLEKELAEHYKVQLEMSGRGYALAMTSVADERRGFERLVRGVSELSRMIERADNRPDDRPDNHPADNHPGNHPADNHPADNRPAPDQAWPRADVVYTPRRAAAMPFETVALRESEGRAAAEFITPYPPGIPVLAPGERVTREILGLLELLKTEGGRARLRVIQDTGE
ncbi:MAG: aminotransferase class I/II-fold pyridoxal phosphate-dependent enzyme [Clostridiales bacterium]|nr:aminotransferase class I/II-fold pyridoxal phosphate-dependent enzyme [Clostridiales bacterium]